MTFKNILDWTLFGNVDQPLVIAGPCSAETREQTIASCKGAAENGAHLLRAGIWKPRTRPNSFEGVGTVGLPWLYEAGQLTGLPTSTEVAKADHIEAALKNKIDVLWIGARTTVNPFLVQELADELQGVSIPVIIKNPVNPDLELWIGAIERFYAAGIKEIAVIHRGFSVYNSAPYRNLPMWEIPIELRRRFPDLSIICDPSHICGRRDLLEGVAQRALDLDFDGLMIETHIDPSKALSDAAQQVTPAVLSSLLKSLVRKKRTIQHPTFLKELERLRNSIDEIDERLIKSIAKRMEIVKEIGEIKKKNDVTILQMNRWVEIFDDRVQATMDAGLSSDFAQNFIQSIHNESLFQQYEVLKKQSKN